MEYTSSEQLYQYFANEIKETASKKMAKLRKEIADLKATELQKIEEEIKSSVDHALGLELKELKIDHSTELNRLAGENAKALMKRRLELLDAVFAEVQSKLIAFTNTLDYQWLMEKKFSAVEKVFSNDKLNFEIRPSDTALKRWIELKFPSSTVSVSNRIEIGGFFVSSPTRGIELNETLDAKLEEQKQAFFEKSNLFIRK